MPQTKTAAPVLQHRNANFTLTACGLGALCAVAALAQGGGASALAGLAGCLLGGWAALKVHYLE